LAALAWAVHWRLRPVVGDVIPFGMVDNHGSNGLNIVGLKRRGATRETIHICAASIASCSTAKGFFEDRLKAGRRRSMLHVPEVIRILDFIRAGEKRPLCVPRAS
jgi:UDP-N-acetylglucosamine acyltransferase